MSDIIKENYSVFIENMKLVILAGRNAIKPVKRIKVSEWAELYRIVSSEASARPGRWGNDLVPFAVEIMDCASDPEVRKLTIWGSAQICKTEIILNIIGYFIHIDPCQIIVLQPTIEMARAFSKSKLEYMIRDTFVVRRRVSKTKSRDSNNATLHKRFIGGELDIAGGNSPNSLAQRSKRVCICDDVDRIPPSAGEEGDPVLLAEKRTNTYTHNSFTMAASTCTVKGRSRIEKRYNQSDKRKPYVPCPKCGHFQILRFGNKESKFGLKWEKEEDLLGKTLHHMPETVWYECENCHEKLTEKDKIEMLQKFEWRAEKPEVKTHRGYWINELYSPFSSWEKIVRDFLDCKDDQEALKVFTNTSLAELWEEEEAVEVDETGLMQRVEDYLTAEKPFIPNGVLVITIGVDTQADRLEAHVIGWGVGEEAWILHYEKLWGDPDQEDVWEDLDRLIEKTWVREDGVELSVGVVYSTGRVNRGVFVDANGRNTQSVYDQCRKRQRNGVIAIMGRAGQGRHVLLNRSLVGKMKSTKLQNIGVDAAKEKLYSRLPKTGSGPGVIHFTRTFCDIDYFKGITSEKAVKEYHRATGETIVWKIKKKGIRNEPLDTWNYSYAAMKSIAPNFESLKAYYESKAEEINKKKSEVKPQSNSIIQQTEAQPAQVVQTSTGLRRSSPLRRRGNSELDFIRRELYG